MGRRTNRKPFWRKNKLPKLFRCPKCEKPLVIQIIRKDELAILKCRNCGLRDAIEFKQIYKPEQNITFKGIEPVDAANALLDRFYLLGELIEAKISL